MRQVLKLGHEKKIFCRHSTCVRTSTYEYVILCRFVSAAARYDTLEREGAGNEQGRSRDMGLSVRTFLRQVSVLYRLP